MITTQHLTRRFGSMTAVEDLSLEVKRGEVFGLLGPNGAGKTTLIRILSALIAPTEGTATVAGHDVRREPDQVRRRVGILTESPGLYRKLSAWDNLVFFARLYGVPDPGAQAERYLRLLGLWDRRTEPVGGFSKGMKQKVAIARALVHEPDLVFLDEPTSGLDPEATRMIREFVADLGSQGRTVFLTTHLLDEAERLCDRVAVFKRKLIAVDTPSNLRRSRLASWVAFDLASHDESLVQALRELPFVREARWRDTTLLVNTHDPLRHNPELVRLLIDRGAEIRFVREERPSLEQVYLSLTGSLRLE